MALLDDFAEPFDPIPPAAVRQALAQHWGIDADTLTRLETERDDTFRAGDVLIKIAHPNDAPELIALQTAVMDHVGAVDPGLPIQRVVRTIDDAESATVEGRIARVLTWLDGDLMLDHPRSDAQLSAAGATLGRLNRALADFEHPAADRELAWDLPRLPQLREYTDDPFVLDVIDSYAADVVPALTALPHQVVHNDFHPGNVLVDPVHPDRVVGVLDFGDALRTARVCDLAVAVAYLLPDADPAWPGIASVVDAFDAVRPLLPEERALLPQLVIARLVMRNLINQATNEADPALDRFYERNLRSIHRILKET